MRICGTLVPQGVVVLVRASAVDRVHVVGFVALAAVRLFSIKLKVVRADTVEFIVRFCYRG
jgi:hypothetical protein